MSIFRRLHEYSGRSWLGARIPEAVEGACLRDTVDIVILCLLTVAKSGITPFIPSTNSLKIVINPIKGAVLVEPFPGTVAQGGVLVFSKEFSGL